MVRQLRGDKSLEVRPSTTNFASTTGADPEVCYLYLGSGLSWKIYEGIHRNVGQTVVTVKETEALRKRKAFYETSDFDKKVEEMSMGRERAHYKALLRAVKPKQAKTLQQQMEEHLAKKQQSEQVCLAF